MASSIAQARVSWTTPDVGNTSITFYEVMFDGDFTQRVGGSPVSVYNRRPGAKYNVTVIAATTQVGPGVVSATAVLQMPGDDVPGTGVYDSTDYCRNPPGCICDA